MGHGTGNAPYHSRTTDSLLQSFSFRRLAMLRTPAHLALTTTTHHSPLRLRRFVHRVANSPGSRAQVTVYQCLTSFFEFANARGSFANSRLAASPVPFLLSSLGPPPLRRQSVKV